ncbi:MAG TPA: hypothetical protein VFG69_21050 [Nannocystaceae bacterium]|nr:hypothetical protein [Nannocystaceae bacterium]
MEPARLRAIIAANIRRYAARRKLGLPMVADLAGVATGALYRVMNAEANIRADTLAKLDVLPRQLVDERGVESVVPARDADR